MQLPLLHYLSSVFMLCDDDGLAGGWNGREGWRIMLILASSIPAHSNEVLHLRRSQFLRCHMLVILPLPSSLALILTPAPGPLCPPPGQQED